MARSTYSLSAAYRALGMRSSRALPEIAEGTVQPTVLMGSLATFAPQVVEARGLTFSNFTENTSAGTWNGLSIHSLSAGGLVIERVYLPATSTGSPANPFVNVAPVVPWTGTAWSEVLAIGGQALESVVRFVERQPNPIPRGDANGGTTLSGNILQTDISGDDPGFYDGIWVPPGSSFWITTPGSGTNGPLVCGIRWREFPEGLGSP